MNSQTGWGSTAALAPSYGDPYGATTASRRYLRAKKRLAKWRGRNCGKLFQPSCAKRARKIAQFEQQVAQYGTEAELDMREATAVAVGLEMATAPMEMPMAYPGTEMQTFGAAPAGNGMMVAGLLGLLGVGVGAWWFFFR